MKQKMALSLSRTLNRLSIDYQNPRWWFDVLVIAMSYYVTSWLVLKKMPISTYGTPVWPAAGLVIGLLLLWGRSRWLGVFLGATLGNYTAMESLILSALAGLGTTLGSLFSVTLILKLTGKNYFLNQVSHVVIFCFCSLFTGTILQCLIGVMTVCLGGYKSWSQYLEIFWGRWIGDSIGILVFTPLVLAWSKKTTYSSIKSWLNSELFITVFTLIIVSYFTFIKSQPVEYLLLPPLLWSAFRFSGKITTLLVAIMSILAAIATSHKMGIFYEVALKNNSILLLQLFIGVIAVTIISMLAIVAENRQAKLNLQIANTELEERVFARTRDLQESEIKAKQLASKAETANQAKSTFIANMSHELRSPLNAVIGFSQLMLRDNNLPKDQYENAGIIYRSGEYLLTLINHILDLAKIEAGKTTLNIHNFDLYRLLDDLEDMLHLQASNDGLNLIFNRSENIPHYICTDEVKLRQVLINLITNSIKFTRQGKITVSVNKKNKELTDVLILHFQIHDTGVGIESIELPKIFEAFSQGQAGKEIQEGTGLGLAISRKFIQLMGGDIAVESELGKGTTFQFYIQVKLGQAIANNYPKEHQRVIGLAPGQPLYKILAVDDKLINRQLLFKLLAPLGFEMKEASNGEEAIAIWDEWEPHLIWMDMRMPVMDGYDATKHIKSTTKGNATAIIALTASVLEEEKAIVLSAGCDDFLRKPFTEDAIFDILAQYLGVKYLYEETLRDEGEIIDRLKNVLQSEDLMVMSNEWILRLYEGSLEANVNLVMPLIKEIPEVETHLKQSLIQLINQSKFEQIVDLTEPLINYEQ
jgi:signal transduction histidine kinase/CheY-like chemotaxis protein